MSTFTQSTTAEAVVPVERQRIWEVLRDPAHVARLTPFVRSIEPHTSDGTEYWVWTMSGLTVMGYGFSATFTERMGFTDGERLEFTHEAPSGTRERAGVEGFYALADGGPGDPAGSTRLKTHLEVFIELPLPRVSGGAVRSAMKGVMATMGDRFAKNLLHDLGIEG